MTTTLPTAAQIAAAEPLDFSARPRSKLMQAEVIHLFYHGVEFTFGISAEAKIHELEQAVDTILKREGWSGAAPQAAPATHTAPLNGRPKSERVTPLYNDAGDPMCPVHRKPLTEGRYGLFCPSKAVAGDVQNDKGYCALKFES